MLAWAWASCGQGLPRALVSSSRTLGRGTVILPRVQCGCRAQRCEGTYSRPHSETKFGLKPPSSSL